MTEAVRMSTLVLEMAGLVVIMTAVALSTAIFLMRVRSDSFESNYRAYRANLGRGILIGLGALDCSRHPQVCRHRPHAQRPRRPRRDRTHSYVSQLFAGGRSQWALAVAQDAPFTRNASWRCARWPGKGLVGDAAVHRKCSNVLGQMRFGKQKAPISEVRAQ